MSDEIAEKSRTRDGDEMRGAASRDSLLQAARMAFAERGLEGARVDDIAKRAGVNKQLVYHYFGSKEGLYAAVLEEVYNEIRQREQALDLSRFPAEEAVRRLIEFSFDYLAENPDFVALVTDENVHGARHLADSGKAVRVNRPVIDLLEATLQRGAADGVFRRGLDHCMFTFRSPAHHSFTSPTSTRSGAFSVAAWIPRMRLPSDAHILSISSSMPSASGRLPLAPN